MKRTFSLCVLFTISISTTAMETKRVFCITPEGHEAVERLSPELREEWDRLMTPLMQEQEIDYTALMYLFTFCRIHNIAYELEPAMKGVDSTV